MTAALTRARRTLGPLVLATLASLVLSTPAAYAHDPGLSALDVVITDGTISVSLSMAAADVALAAASSGGDPRRTLVSFARDAVRVSSDGQTMTWRDSDASFENGGARARMNFPLPTVDSNATRRVTVTSHVPQRLARGHRELLTVHVGGRAATETLLDAESNSVTIDIDAAPTAASRVWSFLTLGVRHILTGYDHLVFLAGLLVTAIAFASSSLKTGVAGRQLLIALTAFTAAHSLSLALVVVAGVHAPSAIVEPLIAASIAWVGVESLLCRGHRVRWWLVFGFGLVHGFGFADALVDIGFGSSAADIALALLSFNGGVEIGQVAAVAAMLPLVWVLRVRPAWQARLLPACSVLIAIAGAYWLIERL